MRSWKELSQLHGQSSAELEASQTAMAESQQELSAAKHSHDEISQRKQRVEYELVRIKAELGQCKQTQQYAKMQLDQIAEQLKQYEADRAEIVEKNRRDEAKIWKCRKSRWGELTQQLAEHRGRDRSEAESLCRHADGAQLKSTGRSSGTRRTFWT